MQFRMESVMMKHETVYRRIDWILKTCIRKILVLYRFSPFPPALAFIIHSAGKEKNLSAKKKTCTLIKCKKMLTQKSDFFLFSRHIQPTTTRELNNFMQNLTLTLDAEDAKREKHWKNPSLSSCKFVNIIL